MISSLMFFSLHLKPISRISRRISLGYFQVAALFAAARAAFWSIDSNCGS